MPRHNPAPLIDDDGSLQGRRLERDERARSRRRSRRQQVTGREDVRSPRTAARQIPYERDLDRQVADWRSELALQV